MKILTDKQYFEILRQIEILNGRMGLLIDHLAAKEARETSFKGRVVRRTDEVLYKEELAKDIKS